MTSLHEKMGTYVSPKSKPVGGRLTPILKHGNGEHARTMVSYCCVLLLGHRYCLIHFLIPVLNCHGIVPSPSQIVSTSCFVLRQTL